MSGQIYCSLCGDISCFCYYCVLYRGTVCNNCADKFRLWQGPMKDRNINLSNKAKAVSEATPNAIIDGDW